MLRNDPVLAARHFDFRLRSFFTDIIQHTLTFGKLKTYFYRIEFQLLGSPHAHCLIWADQAPNMESASDVEIASFFGSIISGQLPDEDKELRALVSRIQRHSHSIACKKNKKAACQ